MSKLPIQQDPLHAQAEPAGIPQAELSTPPAAELMHELRVYQIELEMQNDELRRSQVLLEESRDRYLDLYEFAPVGYLTLTRDGAIAEANLTSSALLRAERKKLLKRRFASYISAEDSDHWLRCFVNTIHNGDQQRCEMLLRRSDGSFFNAQLDFLYMTSGGASSVRVSITDITERKHAEAAIIAAQTKLAATLNAIPDLLFEIGLSGVYYDYHSSRPELLAAPPEALIGKKVSDTLPPAAAEVVMLALHEAHTTGRSRGRQIEVQVPQGRLWFELSIAGKPVAAGLEPRFIVLSRDITERKCAEIELKESRQLLRQLAAQDVAAREAEHKHIAREVHDELGQLLTALRIEVSLLRIQFGARDPVLLQKIQDMLVVVDKVIQGVRDVATNLRPPALDMGIIPAIAWLCDDLSSRTATACTLRVVDAQIDLEDALIVALFRIVQESLTNVSRYAAASSAEVTIWLYGDNIAVEVRDDGKGFDPAAIQATKSFGLLGMRERALALGGKVEIVSAPSMGTVVSVRIPLIQPNKRRRTDDPSVDSR